MQMIAITTLINEKNLLNIILDNFILLTNINTNEIAINIGVMINMLLLFNFSNFNISLSLLLKNSYPR